MFECNAIMFISILGKLSPGRLFPGRLPPTLALTQTLTLTQGRTCLGGGNLPRDKFSGLCLFQKFKNKKNKKLNAMLSLQKIILKRASCLSWLTIVMLAFKCRNEDCANVSANAINKLQQKKDLDIFLGEIYFWDKSWIVTRECGDKSWGKFTSIRIYRNSFICYFNLW